MYLLRFASALGGFFAASVHALLLTLVRRDRSTVPLDYARAIQRWTQPAMGLTVEVQGQEHLDPERPCIYVVNHQSAFDIPILSGLFPARTVLVAKQEIRSIPLFGWIYQATGNIFIDRSNRQAAVSRLREAANAIRERKVSVWIFPEGTRGKVPGELLPFKKGAFNLAVEAGVPLVPIVVSPVRVLYDLGARRFRPGMIRVRVLPPVPTTGLTETDVPGLSSRVWEQMAGVLKNLKSTPASAVARLGLAERQ